MRLEQKPVVVIGSGPAGYTAAIYAARADLQPLVVEGAGARGGALMTTTDVENFPGFPSGVLGPQLVQDMRSQAERFGATFLPEQAAVVSLDSEIKTIETTEGTTIRASAVILATGSRYRTIGLPEEPRYSGHGLSWCATCDGAFHRDRDVAVVGGGDSALEEAIFLTRFARKVTVIHRRDSLRASKVMQARALANPKIQFVWDSVVTQIRGKGTVESTVFRNVHTHKQTEIPTHGLFVAIGHEPNSEIVRGQVKLDDNDYIAVQHPTTATDLAGVFACGDVVDHRYRQAITAAGTGCSAALDAEDYLSRMDVVSSKQWSSADRSDPGGGALGDAGLAGHGPNIEPVGDEATVPTATSATDETFDSMVLTAEKPVLVDFWAEWCGPCQLMLPIMDELAATREEDFLVVKVNVDASPRIAERYDVETLPAFKLFVGGAVVSSITGAKTKVKLLEAIGLPS